MEYLYSNILPIGELNADIEKIFSTLYGISNSNLQKSISKLKNYTKHLRENLFVFVEYPYVDKMYRDTYYHYFASKKDKYPRDAVRLSFFKEKISEADFRTTTKVKFLEDAYMGFLVLRPTFPDIIGRSIIKPEAFINDKILISSVKYGATANGIKLNVNGFPHSSQDRETITCAETTIWSLMEYFGNKYAEYSLASPSKITSVLGKFSFERLLPSKGLTAGQFSYALRELGYGLKIYSEKTYKDKFFHLLSSYVESGIPVIGILYNNQGIGHAVNIIGRTIPTAEQINSLPVSKKINDRLDIYDFADIPFQYVLSDDNHAPYRLALLTNPASNYTDAKWENCQIISFIAPLYHKIYSEAGEARRIALSFIEGWDQGGMIKNNSMLIKTFLTSSRSFKNEIALNDSLQLDAKELLLNTSMPNFIWFKE